MQRNKKQDIAGTAWAFATVKHRDERLFAGLAGAAERRFISFTVQNLANTAWAFATIGNSDAPLFSALARASEQRVG